MFPYVAPPGFEYTNKIWIWKIHVSVIVLVMSGQAVEFSSWRQSQLEWEHNITHMFVCMYTQSFVYNYMCPYRETFIYIGMG
jgi:hypothetical protein